MESGVFDALATRSVATLLCDAAPRARSEQPRKALSAEVRGLRCADAAEFVQRKAPLLVRELEARMSASDASPQREKARVKAGLRAYDAEFKRDVGRAPSAEEKRPMRVLYVRYKVAREAARTVELQARKRELGRVLTDFQRGFERSFGRAVRHARELRPVEREYAEYKAVRAELRARTGGAADK